MFCISIEANSRKKRPLFALIIIAGITLLIVTLARLFEAFEKFTEWSRQHENWQVDELVVVAAVLIEVGYG